jgi:hypothetical protein
MSFLINLHFILDTICVQTLGLFGCDFEKVDWASQQHLIPDTREKKTTAWDCCLGAGARQLSQGLKLNKLVHWGKPHLRTEHGTAARVEIYKHHHVLSCQRARSLQTARTTIIKPKHSPLPTADAYLSVRTAQLDATDRTLAYYIVSYRHDWVNPP